MRLGGGVRQGGVRCAQSGTSAEQRGKAFRVSERARAHEKKIWLLGDVKVHSKFRTATSKFRTATCQRAAAGRLQGAIKNFGLPACQQDCIQQDAKCVVVVSTSCCCCTRLIKLTKTKHLGTGAVLAYLPCKGGGRVLQVVCTPSFTALPVGR